MKTTYKTFRKFMRWMLIVPLSISSLLYGQNLASWNFAGNGASSNVNATSKSADINGISASLGAGFNSLDYLGGSIAAAGQTASTLSAAISGNDYFTFTVTPTSGKSATVTSIQIRPVSQNRARTFALFSSKGGFASGNLIGSFSANGNNGQALQTISVANHATLTTATEFRIYVYGGTDNYESVGIGNRATGLSESDLVVVGTTANAGSPDVIAPSVPNGLASSSVTQISFTLSWSASTDVVGVTGYEVFRNGTSIGTPTSTSFNVTGLSASTNYSMTVRARDAAGNWSSQSSALSVTTSAASGGGPSGYSLCSSEGQNCVLSGTMDVAYGANGSFNYQYNKTGTIGCSNAVFGDPISGVSKSCYTKASATGNNGTGLLGEYFNNKTLSAPVVLSRTDATVNFDFGNGSPGGSVGIDNFSVRWSGQVEAPVSGGYTFSTTSDDGVRLSVNGSQVINNWTDHGSITDNSSVISLIAGQKYNITMEFYESGGGAVAKLLWAYPGQAQQAIPQSRLYPASGSTTVAVTGVSVNPVSASVNVGATTNLSATVAPANATNQSVTWSSSNTSIATVNSSGVVTGVAAGSATITVTTQDGNKTSTAAITVNSSGGGIAISINKSAKNQTIDGFGFFGPMRVWWGSSDPNYFYSDAWLQYILGDMGITIWRNEHFPPIITAGSPAASAVDPQFWGQDADWNKQKPLVQALKAKSDALGVNLKFIYTVWSPPADLKCVIDGTGNRVPGTIHPSGPKWGGALDPSKYGQFSNWLKVGIQNYKDLGIDLYALSPQNEPYFYQSFNSCFYAQSWYPQMLNAVMPAVKSAFPNVKIFGSENMLDMEGKDINWPWFYHSAIKNDPTARNYVDILAVHGYSDGVAASSGTELAKYWTNHKEQFTQPMNKKAWMTETSGYANSWEPSGSSPGALALANDIMSGLVYGDMSGWVYWYGSDGDLMDVTTPKKPYFASKQFFRYIRPGSVRVTATSADNSIAVAAFENIAKNTNTVVLINNATSAKTINLSGVSGTFEMFASSSTDGCVSKGNVSAGSSITLPARSVVTLHSGTTSLRVGNENGEQTMEEKIADSGISLYPNPASNKLLVNLPLAAETSEINLEDLSGRVVVKTSISGNLGNVDISTLNSGIYVVKAVSGGKIYISKFVKE